MSDNNQLLDGYQNTEAIIFALDGRCVDDASADNDVTRPRDAPGSAPHTASSS